VRRAGGAALVAVLALAGAVALLLFFTARDEPELATPAGAGPGEPAPGATSDVLARGNVVIQHRRAADGAALRALAEEFSGPPDPAIEEAGTAVLVRRRAGADAPVVALAWRRRLEATGPDDPRLRAFVESWLGRGRG
jgi:hypothetical protein